jgi:GNAT superfamily N-acetyltransferase
VLIRPQDSALDAALADRGWRMVDPVVVYAAPVAELTADLPPLAAFPHWPPLAIARSIWDEGGIGPARLAVMDRAAGPKAAIWPGRRPPGRGGLCRLPRAEAMLHALEVRPPYRRRGIGATLLRAAANGPQVRVSKACRWP